MVSLPDKVLLHNQWHNKVQKCHLNFESTKQFNYNALVFVHSHAIEMFQFVSGRISSSFSYQLLLLNQKMGADWSVQMIEKARIVASQTSQNSNMNDIPSIQFPSLACTKHICMIVPLCFAYVLEQKILIDLEYYYKSIRGEDSAVSYLYTYLTFGNLFFLASRSLFLLHAKWAVSTYNTFTKSHQLQPFLGDHSGCSFLQYPPKLR